ncbi:MAG: rod shape-determining protein MreC [Treponemataceae bacterium]|nr:MAG: rod shape-determining protein MreC [Treponemataceae bacterium]
MEAKYDFARQIRFMKRIYAGREKHSMVRVRLPFFFLIFLIVLSASMLAFSSGGFIIDFKRLGFSVFSTLQSGVSTVIAGAKNTVNAAKEITRLKREYDDLTRRLEAYEEFQRSNAELRAENERLKELLGFARGIGYKNYPALIIARDPDTNYASITINKGSAHGIKKDMPVIAIQNGEVGLVGKITEVRGRNTSMVMCIYDSKCYVSARIGTADTRDIGLVSGKGSEDKPLVMEYVKKRVYDENKLKYGDPVVTSGETDNYLRNILIGRITDVKTHDYSSLDIELTPVIDFSRLESVLVVDVKSPFDEEQ